MNKTVESVLIKIAAIIIILILIVVAIPAIIIGIILLAFITIGYFIFQIGKKEDNGIDKPV
jgi:hypothetical protein